MSDVSDQRRYYERMMDEIGAEYRSRIADLQAENAKLREQMERLVTLLRVDCDIDASWDGLRRFWSIELTESGCLMRDRACEAEAENAKLRELACDMAHVLTEQYCGSDGHSDCANWDACGLYRKCEERLHACSMWYRMEKLGIEVD